MQHVLSRPKAAVRTVPAALAVTAVLGLGALAPAAAAATCGTPGQPATYQTVQHPAVTQTVPAVTHAEWLWTRQVATVTQAVSRTIPGYDVIRWSRTTTSLELEYAEKVVDQPAVAPVPATPEQGHFETVVLQPAVTLTLWEYLHLVNGNTRWEEEGWNAGDKGKGWAATGNTDEVVTIPAVTTQQWVVDVPASPGSPGSAEVSHVELHWLPEGETPPAGWTATEESRVASTSTETVDLPEGEAPDGTGWSVGDVVDSVPDVVDTQWIGADDTVPDGYGPTGETETSYATETTDEPSAAAPAGDGWTPVEGSEVTVVDEAERVVEVSPAWVEQVLLSPAVPAGPACVNPPPLPPVVDGPPAPPAGPVEPEVAAPTAQAAPAAVAGVLPAAGTDAPAWVPFAGIALVLAGVRLIRRRREEDA